MAKIGGRHRIALLIGSAILAVLIGFGFKAYPPSSQSRSFQSGQVRNGDVHMANAINAFSLDMFLRAKSDDNNLVLSPFSVFAALGVVSEGAGGQTRLEIGKILGISQPDSGFHERLGEVERQIVGSVAGTSGELDLANGVWIAKLSQSSISQQFKEIIRANHAAEIREIGARQSPESVTREINDWVNTKTRGKIKELIPSGQVNPAALMMIVNALYFKCPWAIQFRPGFTCRQYFNLLTGSRVEVPMMSTSSDDYRYMERSGLQLLEMPYLGSFVSMVIFLPGKPDGLAELEKSLTSESLPAWLGKLAPHAGGVEVFLPRFSVRSRLRLVPNLKSMGLIEAFDSHKADFSRLFDPPIRGVSISEILHESIIDVNEEGTVAAAATGMAVLYAAGERPSPKVFRADRPFMFMIIHRPTNCILFMGRVTNPLETGEVSVGRSKP